MIKVCLAGATGWAGSELARGIAGTDDISLVAATSRSQAGRTLGDVLGELRLACTLSATATEAFATPPRELAARLARVRAPEPTIPVDRTVGPREARGATLGGTQVHSVRLPSFVISAEVIFGMPDQRLTIRHDSGSSARPYVDGALIAIRKVHALVGVHRGLDRVLDL